jgi:nucleoside-diphosphate-sugar epimerase
VRVLVTGDRGAVGVPVAGWLRRAGYEVAGFDRAGGADVLDVAAVRRAARGCGAVVHLAALAHDSAGSPEQIMAVNVLGTWHVLLAAEAAGAGGSDPRPPGGTFPRADRRLVDPLPGCMEPELKGCQSKFRCAA